jgi:hypothetical protein
MAAEIAGGTGVTCVEETTDIFGFLAAGGSSAFENVGFTVVKIFNRRNGLEKRVNRCIPSLHETVY